MPEWIASNLLPIGICVLAYLTGSGSSAIIVCKALKLTDPRILGSKNPGASNVLRNHGKLPAALTFAGDVIKVILPIGIGQWLQCSPLWLSWIACAGCVGHMYPIYYRFEGGKGVATAFGAIYMLFWPLAVALSGIWLILAKLTGTASIASIVAWALAPVILYFWEPALWPGIACISLLIIYRHRSNIERLLSGTENTLNP